MIDITFSNNQGLTSFAQEGLVKKGVNVICASSPKTKIVGCWGWRLGQELRNKGHEVLVFERGYLGNRKYWTGVAWNGLNGYGDFCVPEKVTSDRFERNFKLKPWKANGRYIVIMGQIVGDASLKGQDMTPIYENIAADLSLKYCLPVYYRPHPDALGTRANFKPDIETIGGDLQDCLADAHLIVCYNSNSAVDAVVNGVPAVTLDLGAMAYSVTGHGEYDRITPDRREWASRLAYCQWSPEEISNGVFWEQLKCKLES